MYINFVDFSSAYCGTNQSRRWIERRDVGTLSSLERRDVVLNVATLENVLSGTSRRCPERRNVALFKAHITFIFFFYPTPLLLNPSSPCVDLPHRPLPEFPTTLVGGQYSSLRHPLCTPPSPSHTQSTVWVSHSHYTPLRYSHIGLVIHLRSRSPHLGLHLGSHLGFFPVGSHLGSLVHLVSILFS